MKLIEIWETILKTTISFQGEEWETIKATWTTNEVAVYLVGKNGDHITSFFFFFFRCRCSFS